ncbi:DEAD/DEAH box helicase [Corynebacterium alimapuense]|uniref:Damage-inducible protein n=1 Tax=Corynebacterium alimapuense TaxID=1576874 RepID=A0A3M8K4E6_9CORY|nr:DEAD/DEAH box helicase [Corynebacterium alimapuense]RNE48056.1 damage-inducible protein [Corynebacterium alimapuense]
MSTVEDVYTALRELPTNSHRGTAFEKLMVRYFQLHPTLSQEYDYVTRWTDWDHNANTADTGIDLVAHRIEDDSWTAIQCKFYEQTSTLAKSDLDSFFTASGRTFTTDTGTHSFSNRIIISTTDRWGKNAEAAIADQTIPVQRFGLAEIAEAPIDWDIAYPAGNDGPVFELTEKTAFQPRPHQQLAIENTLAGFSTHDRGKLIMACGTGKTFTALKLAETFAHNRGGKARVLFCVPSISLLSQSLREWTANSELDLRCYAVCSDNKVSRDAEDIAAYELEIPVTTNGELLAEYLGKRKRAAGLTVVFTTYQSLPAIHNAQQAGAEPFDLVICDEAHRTTGITLAGEDASNFVKIHDNDYIRADKRLYMTATPRLFDEKIKDKAEDHFAEISSMDDEHCFGPEFHRLGFGEAVEKGLLTDYKVLVLTVDQEVAAETSNKLATDSNHELPLDDVTRLIGCWNGLAKRSGSAQDSTAGFSSTAHPMQRAVAFARDIKTSTRVAENLPLVTESYTYGLRDKAATNDHINTLNLDLQVEAKHVDGTMNALTRGRSLQWLKAPIADDHCRVLTNARCLSEGVDVPALDAVMFLNPRNSVVDVVQSVGRVMRKTADKKYGYIILPVGIPAGTPPAQALADNQRFRVVWQVLNALRAHDDRFNAIINSATLNTPTGETSTGSSLKDKLEVEHIGLDSDAAETPTTADQDDQARQIALFSLEEWQEAIYTRIVDKVGDRTYWEDWADDVADIAHAQITRITEILDTADEDLLAEFETFLEGLRGNLNESITQDDAISMLSQHLITAPVFDALFAEHNFASHNPVSQVMQRMVDALSDKGLESETQSLEKFYASVQARASEVSSAAGKQEVIRDLYERFFKKAFSKQSEALGIVYTPVEIVDFILNAANDLSQEHFGRGLSDEGVHVLDPFTGTGTFMVRLLQSGIVSPADLARKYASELHATEIMLLAYYVAAVNIEATYHALVGEKAQREGDVAPGYEPFGGIALSDTFQMYEEDDQLDLEVFVSNNDRIERQKTTPIHVIVGNPPYSVGQSSANDDNANVKYPSLDRRIEETYAAKSTGTNQNSLYDSYLRALRWATDRVDEGIVAFVSNGGWLDGNTADGIRLSLVEDYSDMYIFNLRGNARTAGEQRRTEAGNVFGAGARTTIAIFVGIKKKGATGCRIHYRDIGDYLSAKEKLEIISTSKITSMDWETIKPNSHGDWLSQRSVDFGTWPVLGDKKKTGVPTFFTNYSAGLKTARDTWCYAPTPEQLEANIRTLLDTYGAALSAFESWSVESGHTGGREADANAFLRARPEFADTTKISWDANLKMKLAQGHRIAFTSNAQLVGTYRPFTKQWVYFHKDLNQRRYQLPSMFPTPTHDNIGIEVAGASSPTGWSVLGTNRMPDVQLLGNAQFFSRWTWEPIEAPAGMLSLSDETALSSVPGVAGEMLDGYRRVDNITDEILNLYRDALGVEVSKDEIFYFVYGQLHDPAYREAYATDLKKMLPHIETPTDRDRFFQLATAGRQLMDLHIGYEDAEPWPVDIQVKSSADPADRGTWRVTKLKWKKVRDPETKKLMEDRTTLVYNSKVTISGIPVEADSYTLGSRSALAWIVDRYQVKKHKDSGIINDPNDWADEVGNPRYIAELIAKVTRVAVETTRIVDSLKVKD